jgi:hypothetical protein
MLIPRPFFSCLLFLVAVAGCGPDQVTSPASPTPAAVPSALITATPDGYAESDDPEEQYASFQARAAMRSEVRVAIGSASNWRQAQAAVREVLPAHGSVPDFEKEQYVATLMLRTHLLTGSQDLSPAQLDAIGDYTDLLIGHRNPNAPLVDEALSALEGHWPDSRVADRAESAYRAAERYVGVKSGCDGCSLEVARQSSARRIHAVEPSVQLVIDGADALSDRMRAEP